MKKKALKKNLKPVFRQDKEERINNSIQFMLIYKSEMEFDRRDFNADKVKLFEPVRQEMTKIYIHDLLSFGSPNLERYHFMERDENS